MHPRLSRLSRLFRTLLALAAVTLAITAALRAEHPLEGRRLAQNWLFVKGDPASFDPAAPAALVAPGASAAWAPVTVPHTWNSIDAQTTPDYYRGPGWYKTTVNLDASDLANNQRAYLRFEAVSTVADVWLNGHHLGTHLGAFNAFTYEITPYARAGANELVVRADNSRRPDLAPLSGDFSIFGGIYRPVHLIIKPATSFNLLDHGSSGVAIDQVEVTPERATIRVTLSVSTTDLAGENVSVGFVLREAIGSEVLSAVTSLPNRINGANYTTLTVHIDHPHLWQGVDDPYCYTLEAYLYDNNANPNIRPNESYTGPAVGPTLDTQSWPLALRSITIDPARGLLLNGHPYKLHGVNRHQDRPDKGWAISDDDQAEDVRIMREMGVNAVRTAHYPQSETFYDLCQRAGILAWCEIPVVDTIGKPTDPAFAETTRGQLVENIRQRRNYANIFTWSIANELLNKPTDDPAPLLASLDALARKEDPFRPTTLAANHQSKPICNATTLLALNHYSGWYDKDIHSMPKNFAAYNALGGNRGLAISEYGAGASVRQHQQNMAAQLAPPPTKGPWHPEEWQAIVHETIYPFIAETDACWGGFLWAMFDFASAGRHEGDTPARNDKGLVTCDRQTRKDAFYYYKANWSKEPTLHITSRRDTDRKDARTEVKAYTNATTDVTLTLNGKVIGTAKPDAYHICRWPNVLLAPGQNEVTVTAERDAQPLRDTCAWTLAP